MTVGTEFFDWQRKSDDPAFNRCSPNLVAIKNWMFALWPMTALGCYGERDIRAGVTPSSHSHGAAIDLRYGPGADARARALDAMLPTLINNSEELHVQAIHDYFGCRIWRAWRTPDIAEAHNGWWRAQPRNKSTGMGESWAVYLHIETTLSGWGDDRPIDSRFEPEPLPEPEPEPPAPPEPLPEPPTENVDPAPAPAPATSRPVLRQGSTGAYVIVLQTLLRDKLGYAITVDGNFGLKTQNFVTWFQATHGLDPDGAVGRNTWALLEGL